MRSISVLLNPPLPASMTRPNQNFGTLPARSTHIFAPALRGRLHRRSSGRANSQHSGHSRIGNFIDADISAWLNFRRIALKLRAGAGGPWGKNPGGLLDQSGTGWNGVDASASSQETAPVRLGEDLANRETETGHDVYTIQDIVYFEGGDVSL
jgi:hypothetical protein